MSLSPSRLVPLSNCCNLPVLPLEGQYSHSHIARPLAQAESKLKIFTSGYTTQVLIGAALICGSAKPNDEAWRQVGISCQVA